MIVLIAALESDVPAVGLGPWLDSSVPNVGRKCCWVMPISSNYSLGMKSDEGGAVRLRSAHLVLAHWGI